MESYTKKVMGDYYDSLDMSDDEMEKLQELKQKRDEESTFKSGVYYKRDKLSNVRRQLQYFRDRLEDGSGEEEQLEKTNQFIDQLEEAERKSLTKINELDEKIEEIEDKMSSEGLVFYDKERNVPMDR